MNKEYHLFCQADSLFYDVPSTLDTFPALPLPPGWRHGVKHEWSHYAPIETDLPGQGWKIHVSGRPDNAERLIAAVSGYCLPRGITFKFLRSPHAVFMRNAKYAPRGGSGKLLTIYPRGEAELERTCRDLDDLLAGEQGPYILSDLRIAAGPLHVRYGGFVPRFCLAADGERVAAIEDPSGALVPDQRSPAFTPPAWVELPAFLTPHLKARQAVTVAALPYEIDSALHHSNGGGVYRAHERDGGELVVLKEARPHAGLTYDGADAVRRLRHERDMLQRLAGIAAVPRLAGYFALGEHEFLAMQFVQGTRLGTALFRRYPLIALVGEEGDVDDYTRWALRTLARIEEVIADIHRRGIVYGDLHLGNVILRRDDSVVLIDHEAAFPVGQRRRPAVAAPGFLAPADRTGFDLDDYALAVLRLTMFLPLPTLLQLDPGKAGHFAGIIAEHFPVPETWLKDAVAVIAPDQPPCRPTLRPDRPGWQEARTSITRAILAAATPKREDRLFPGDIAQFSTGGLNLAHGAAGVLYALEVTGAGRFPEHEEWLLHRTRPDAEADLRPGLYDGLHGIAYVLNHLGHTPEALRLLATDLPGNWDNSGHDLYGGLSGIGLNLLHFARLTGDLPLRQAAHRVAALLAGRYRSAHGDRRAPAGLMFGASGPALLFITLYEDDGDPAYLDLAATALRHDLNQCVTPPGGCVQVDQGWRLMPYLAEGSIGIGLVLRRYLKHRHDADFATTLQGIRRTARVSFYAQPGLFNGRAGALPLLTDTPEHAAPQIRRLAWHAMPHQGGLAFPGDQLLRLSADLATGAAGILLALGAVLHDRPVHLPFLRDTDVPSTPVEQERR